MSRKNRNRKKNVTETVAAVNAENAEVKVEEAIKSTEAVEEAKIEVAEEVKTEVAEEVKAEAENVTETENTIVEEKVTEAAEVNVAEAVVGENSDRKMVLKKETAASATTKKTNGKKKKKKKRTKKEITFDVIRAIIFSISLGVFAFALTGLAVIGWGYYSSQREYKDLNDNVVIGSAENQTHASTAPAPTETDANGEIIEIETEPVDRYIPIEVDEEYYRAVNSDYAFFLYIPGTAVKYPVVQSPEKEYYLRYTFKGTENMAGAISVDYRTERDTYFQKFNLIISGHNRQDGTMFSDMTKYEDEAYRDQNPYVYVVMGDKEYIFEIFACYLMDPISKIYSPNTNAGDYIKIINENNTYKKKTEITPEDTLLTMYTCNEDSSKRYLIHSKLIQVHDN